MCDPKFDTRALFQKETLRKIGVTDLKWINMYNTTKLSKILYRNQYLSETKAGTLTFREKFRKWYVHFTCHF